MSSVAQTLHTEGQNPPNAALPEKPIQAESEESNKPKRGGRRPGAGRPVNLAKRLLKGFSRDAIAEAVAGVDCGAVIVGLLKSKKERTRLETLAFVRDTLIGRPAQNLQLSGGLIHAHWTPGCMSHLTDEEVDLLDKLTKKLTTPVSNALPGTPQNQTNSIPRIEAEIVEEQARTSETAPQGTAREGSRRMSDCIAGK